jgi:hypothetical protein
MKRKLFDFYENPLKKQKISKKRNRDDETVFDIIPVFKKIKINEKDDIQKYTQYRRDILLYT